MASSGSVFSETLQTITTTKLEELAKQRNAYEEQSSSLLATAKAQSDPLQRLCTLVDGTKTLFNLSIQSSSGRDGRLGTVLIGGTNKHELEQDIVNIDRFLEQARYDPSVSPKVLEDWEKCILQYISVQSSKYQYADLYGKLVTEWLSSEKSDVGDGDVKMGESFEELPGAKKLEARKEWEKLVFEPANVDASNIKAYLRGLFGGQKHVTKFLDEFRDEIAAFERRLTSSPAFNQGTLRWVIDGLQHSDLLSNEKREVLKDFLSNSVILDEIADVLNMRITALSRWTWGDHVDLEQRRKLNGQYSVHMHEDLLQAIFLQFIGVKWSVFFKVKLHKLGEVATKSAEPVVPKNDLKRRFYYLGKPGIRTDRSLQSKRAKTHHAQYSLHQLLDNEYQKTEIKEGEEEVDYAAASARPVQSMVQSASMARDAPRRQMASKAARRLEKSGRRDRDMDEDLGFYLEEDHFEDDLAEEAEEDDDELHEEGDSEPDNDNSGGNQQVKRPMVTKQNLLHILSTEIVVNTKLHGGLACFHAVFDSWNPLLPHTSILEVMSFFGVSEKWISFFKTFLEAPLKFVDDSKTTEPKTRRRGTPGSHVLSDVFGETILFCLDIAVKRDTNGGSLYRMYDDIWFWSPSFSKCVTAWSSVLAFNEVMGVQLHAAKTGSVYIRSDPDTPFVPEDNSLSLPQGEIRWGFLHLHPTTGQFQIDQNMVDSQITELRTQLAGKTKSVIDWIQVWNSFAATFFSSNFGKASNCFGRAHVDMMLKTHRRIQEAIFPGGNVVQFLKQAIHERFGVSDIPDGFLFFPVELGGLDLKSPFVHLLQIRESVRENPYDIMDEFFEEEKDAYARAKQFFDKGTVNKLRTGTAATDPSSYTPASTEDQETFFPFSEFIAHREVLRKYPYGHASLTSAYRDLLRKPTEKSVNASPDVTRAISKLTYGVGGCSIHQYWTSMDAYWKWVAQMYGPEMIDRFGGLNVVDKGLLPIGMVSLFRGKRVKWHG